ncbi:MAG: hypothetical protein M1840_003868 [Geoglossum simile]|nr:MAG: hypothetical protein M1840_003868 [Geoglossum simile]
MAQTLSSTSLQVLQKEREDFWRKYSGYPEEDIQAMWAEAVHSATTDNNCSAIQSNHWGREVPRSLSTGGQSQSFYYTGLPAHAPMPSLQREYSRQSAPAAMTPMTRSSTQNSSCGPGLPQESLLVFGSGSDDPTGVFPPGSSRTHRSGSGRGNLRSVVEQGCAFEAVGDFLYRMDPGYTYAPMSAPEPPSKKVCDRRSICSDSASSLHYYASHYPSTPTSAELTNGTNATGGMSRQPSTMGSSICGAFEMARLESVDSDLNVNAEHSQLEFSQSVDKSIIASAPFHYDLSYIGAVGDPAQFPSQSFDQPSLQLSTNFSEDMSREGSNQSTDSASSRYARRRIQLAQASRPLAPKQTDDPTMSRQPSATNMVPLASSDGSQPDGQGISRIEERTGKHYTRPQRPRVMCKLCDECPDGFRGDHELRRHHDRAHGSTRKAWIAVQCPDTSGPFPEVALANCKSCRANKKYYAYYNAAAHLRRAHFNPKTKRKSKGKVASTVDEKRGGKGGGDLPRMEVLKRWMKEVEEACPEPTSTGEGSSDAEDEKDASFSISPSTGATRNGYNETTDTTTTTPITGSQAAVDNGYYRPERQTLYSSMNYNDDYRNSYLESDSTTALPDIYQVNSSDPTSLNELSSFNEELPSFYIDDVNHFRNGGF